MGKLLIVIVLECCLANISIAQTTYAVPDSAYIRAVEHGFVSLKTRDYKTGLSHYQRAFVISQKGVLSLLRAAVCAQQSAQNEQAKTYLKQAIGTDLAMSERLWRDSTEYAELQSLRHSPLATEFLEAVEAENLKTTFNPVLRKTLQEIYLDDQQPRLRLDTLRRVGRANTSEARQLLELIHQNDSINRINVETILAQEGYPGWSRVGKKQSGTVWMILRRAPLSVQKKYLPLLLQAAEQGEIHSSHVGLLVDLAVLTDRVRLKNGQKQWFGSQVQPGLAGKVYRFEPIEDEFNVDQRRKALGLPPLEHYAKQWGIFYVQPVAKR